MRILCYAAAFPLIRGSLVLDAVGDNPAPSDTDVETIVFLRHGEKPAEGLGQLTCRLHNSAPSLVTYAYLFLCQRGCSDCGSSFFGFLDSCFWLLS